MGFAVGESDAAGLRDGGERKRIRGGSGADEENRDVAFEDLAELAVDSLVEFARAVSGREAAGIFHEAGCDGRMRAGPIV